MIHNNRPNDTRPAPVLAIYPTRDAALDALIDEKGNDYTTSAGGEFYFKTDPDTFGDGPYRVAEYKGGWTIA